MKDQNEALLPDIARRLLDREEIPKEALGYTDEMVDSMYAQAYRLYDTGRYKDALKMFRLLVVIDAKEFKYTMGVAACHHMMKEFRSAIQIYTICSLIDGQSPIPYFHMADCSLNMKDKLSAHIVLGMAVKRAGDKPEFKMLKDKALLMIASIEKELDQHKKEEMLKDAEAQISNWESERNK